MKSGIITKNIWILSIVSLFTDMASEMLYPVMPVFLKSIGFSFLLIGILEGIAEAVAGLGKSYFGKQSDRTGKRLIYIKAGYGLSSISKPMMAIFIFPLWIFLARTIDRIGKGLRTGARDAMLSDECTKENKGRVFGFHRGMDTLGAVIGPAIALIYLYFHPKDYRMLFIIAFVPGILATLLLFIIKEKKKNRNIDHIKKPGFFNLFSYWKNSGTEYKKLITGFLIFSLVNSSDVFLLLKIKESGLNDYWVIGIYIFYNLIYASLSYPMGILADKIGLKKIYLIGLLLFVIVYIGFAFNSNVFVFFALFFIYAIYAASTEGVSKAWIATIVPKSDTAGAIGTYSGMQSFCALFASSITGLLWFKFGAGITFTVSAIVTLLAFLYLLKVHRSLILFESK